MQNGFVPVICQLGIFVICAQAIVHFRPKASYEKYLKLLVSAMMVLQFFLFVSGMFSADGKQKLEERIGWFADRLTTGMEEAAQNTFFSETDMELQITNVQFQEAGESGAVTDKVPEISIQIDSVEPIRIGTAH